MPDSSPRDMPDPDELIQEAKRGSGEALAELLLALRPYLRLLARMHVDRHLQAKLDPSDLVQETMTAAHQDFASFRGQTEEDLAAWIRGILAHVSANAIRHYKRKKRDVRLERQLQQEIDQSSQVLGQTLVASNSASSPSHRAMRRETAVRVAQALDELSPDYREVLILRELEGLKLVEVAQRMGRSEDSVQKLWARAVMQMRNLLENNP